MQPPVGPENCVLAISNFCDNGHSKESFDRRVHLDLESRPGPIRFSFLQPQPTHPESPSQLLQPRNAKASEFWWPKTLGQANRQCPPFASLLPLQRKPLLIFIDSFKSSGRKIHCHSQVYQHGSEHKLNQNLSPGLCEQIRFPARKSISDPINDWLNLLLCQFPQGKRDS